MQSSGLPTICNPEVGEHKNHIFAKSILSAPFDPNLNVAFTLLHGLLSLLSFVHLCPLCPPFSSGLFPLSTNAPFPERERKKKIPGRECAMRWMIFDEEEEEEVGDGADGDNYDDDDDAP